MTAPIPDDPLEGDALPIAVIPRGIRPRPSPGQARRIDRLSRRAHRFHRFAHHPLCGRYADEVVRIGKRTRLCRGCAFGVLGGLAGGVAGLVAPGTSPFIALAAGTALLVPTIASRRRLPKLVTRFAPAACFALSLTTSALAWHPLPFVLALLIVVGLRVLYGRRGGDRSPCQTCPERDASPCSGFAPIVRREQAFQRVIRRYF